MSDTNDTNEKNPEDFSELVKEYDLKTVGSNAALEGRIVDIVENRVVIDIGQKTEGILDREELLDWDGNLKYKVGDTIKVLAKNVNFKEGYIIVSKKQLDEQEGWENIFHAYKRNEPLPGRIIKLTPDENGYIVDMGVEMFLPMSQVDIQKVKAPKKMLGKDFMFLVVKLNKKEKSGTLSRRILLEGEKQEKQKQLLESLAVGQTAKGIVTSIVDYGAFVDLGGLEGLVHKDNISYGRINHPREKLRKGDEIEVKVLEIDKERGKISLGIKQRFTDPWLGIESKYPLGKRLVAKVVKIVSFGAFIELEEGVEGPAAHLRPHLGGAADFGGGIRRRGRQAVGAGDRDQQGGAQDQAGPEAARDAPRGKIPGEAQARRDRQGQGEEDPQVAGVPGAGSGRRGRGEDLRHQLPPHRVSRMNT